MSSSGELRKIELLHLELLEKLDKLTSPKYNLESPYTLPTKFMKSFQVSIVTALKAQPLFNIVTPNRIATILAPTGNSGTIYIGDDQVATDSFGYDLAGGSSIDSYLDDLSKWWIIGTVAGDKLKVNVEWGYGTA